MTPNEIQIRSGVCSLDAHGWVCLTMRPGVEETLADAQEGFRAATVLRAGRPSPISVDLRSMKSQDREARQFYASPTVTDTTIAVALLVESRVSMLIANFFISITKTRVPTKIFTSEAEARTWLKGYMQ
jgi:hypothetical protein